MKKIIGIALFVFLLGCATTPRPSEILNCDIPEGREYVCYSDKECNEYLSGYSAVFSMKTAPTNEFYGLGQAETHPVVHMNLYYDHKGMYLLGRMEGEERNGEWYMKIWVAVYDEECSLLHESYEEGFRKEKSYGSH